jgi:hypothetical protein
MIIPFGFLQTRNENVFNEATAVWSFRKIYSNWDKAVVRLERSSDADLQFVFFDGDEITLSSFIGTTVDTPSATTLGTWIGSNDAYIYAWNAQNSSNTVDSNYTLNEGGTNVNIITSGVLDTKNSKVAAIFAGAERLVTSGVVPEMQSGNTFTMVSVSNNDTSSNLGCIFSIRVDAGNGGVILYNDRRTNKLFSQVINDSGTSSILLNLATENVADQKLLTLIVDSSTSTAFNNNVEQDNNTWSGTYDSDAMQVGVDKTNSFRLTGSVQELALFPSDKTSDLTLIHNNINDYYSIY